MGTDSIAGITVAVEDNASPTYDPDTLDTTYNLFPAAPDGASKVTKTPRSGGDDEEFSITGLHPGTPYIIEITGGTVDLAAGGDQDITNAQIISNFVTKPATPDADVNLKVLSTDGTGDMCLMWHVSEETSYYTKIDIDTVSSADTATSIQTASFPDADDESDSGIHCVTMTGHDVAETVQLKMKLTTEATASLTQVGDEDLGSTLVNLTKSTLSIKAEKVSDSCYYYDDEWSCLIKVMPDYLGDGMDDMLDYHYTIKDADASQVDHHDECETTGTAPDQVRTCEHWVTGMEKEDHDYTMKFTKVCIHGKTATDDCVEFPADDDAYHYTFKSSAVSVQAVGVLGMTLIALIAKKLF